jgi:hypothetical protein
MTDRRSAQHANVLAPYLSWIEEPTSNRSVAGSSPAGVANDQSQPERHCAVDRSGQAVSEAAYAHCDRRSGMG